MKITPTSVCGSQTADVNLDPHGYLNWHFPIVGIIGLVKPGCKSM